MFKRLAPIISQAYWIDFYARHLQGETMSDNIPLDVQRDPTSSTAGLNSVSSFKEQILRCRPDENAAMSKGMSRFEAAINFVFGVVLPTVDVGSDFFNFRPNGFKIDNEIHRSKRIENVEKDV